MIEGTIVDVTVIGASDSTKNQKQKCDQKMKTTGKGNQWYFRMRVHIGTDMYSRVNSVVVADAAVHDSQMIEDLVHGNKQAVYSDKAYADAAGQAKFKAVGVE